MKVISQYANPFRPGAGHMPPYLAGRQYEENEFRRLLKQNPIMQNLILTGLRGVGKTVLLETLKPIAMQEGWGWVGTDLSEAASLSESNMATRILADLSVFTSAMTISSKSRAPGFQDATRETRMPLTFGALMKVFNDTPGLISDKLKYVLEYIWSALKGETDRCGIIFAYDEAQNLDDSADKDQYPLSLILDVFQSIQRKGIRFMLLLTGLPTLFPKLVESRTYSERMFHLLFLDQLDDAASRDAILKPVENHPLCFNDASVRSIINVTSGYPYFIQFVCKEVYDIWLQQLNMGEKPATIPLPEIVKKLDADFFSGRWARATDRQRDLLGVVATLPHCDGEFTVHDIVAASKKELKKPFTSSHVNQLLASLSDNGLVYRNRYAKYSFAVPLFGEFIRRQPKEGEESLVPMWSQPK
jgi:hypothetical protein